MRTIIKHIEMEDQVVFDVKDSLDSYYVFVNKLNKTVTFYSKSNSRKNFCMALKKSTVESIIKHCLN